MNFAEFRCTGTSASKYDLQRGFVAAPGHQGRLSGPFAYVVGVRRAKAGAQQARDPIRTDDERDQPHYELRHARDEERDRHDERRDHRCDLAPRVHAPPEPPQQVEEPVPAPIERIRSNASFAVPSAYVMSAAHSISIAVVSRPAST